MQKSLKIKKVLISTFFCVCLSLTPAVVANKDDTNSSQINCPSSDEAVNNRGYGAEAAFVHHITDGDTLVLTNGERVRLLGINTPEVNFRNPEKSQPLAIDARNRLKQMLPDGSRVTLIFDQRKKDRYKRQLAFIRYTDEQGNELDIGEQLLEQGLAWQYLILPNQLCWQNYREAETKAYKNQIGVWDKTYYQIEKASRIISGDKKRQYRRIAGKVTASEHSKKNYWFIIDDNVWLGIAKKDSHYFNEAIEKIKNGTLIQISGWMYRSYGKLRIKARHPQALRFLKKLENPDLIKN